MKILYLGAASEHTTSSHRADALRRLGHDVFHVDPRRALPKGPLIGGLSTRFGLSPFAPLVMRYLQARVASADFDLAWIDGGPELGPNVYRWLKHRGMKILNYNVDDPFGTRDGRKWDLYTASVPWHDLTAVVRTVNVDEAKAHGARHVVRVFRSYDQAAHAGFIPSDGDLGRYASEVSFIGTWMPERGPFLALLLELGVPLSIWGNRWQKAPEWRTLKSAWRGPGLLGRDFVAATVCSKVALGFLSKGNRDLHTTRSAEIPYMGGPAFCAERTIEHAEMFREGKEAVFWADAEECAEQCASLLADDTTRSNMARAAKLRVQSLGLSNDAVLAFLVDALTPGVVQTPVSPVYANSVLSSRSADEAR